MPYDPIQIQGQGHRCLKCTKIADFKGIFSANIHVMITGMLSPSPRGRGLDAKMLGLSLVASGLVLSLIKCWPRSYENCPRGLVFSY